MPSRHPVPRRWLFVDDRLGNGLWCALRRLPPGSGVVFRARDRAGEARYVRVRRIARARRLVLLSADSKRAGAAGVHNGLGPGLRSRSVHDRRELLAARRAIADLIFVSPVFATRSHPEAAVLGPHGFAWLARGSAIPVIALGGMTERRWRRLPDAHGWAGIDAWVGSSGQRTLTALSGARPQEIEP
ncbi:thiamine-phosphate pyrophosphorylase [Sphingomonas guangdongensis]|uniref:Thiamine-phosphate pyrophosphorylase n=1 Tax=Sphingomonas guangdongensis TaxID=1141890 RepID=A0A285QEV6_9SPHN|nr:thiamine phosphate synthase [Sphingomonas guangdongensis]SOB80413.1 thiamine-phosphate pyrophosphorylase [Sphingomonas guangdongensis]